MGCFDGGSNENQTTAGRGPGRGVTDDDDLQEGGGLGAGDPAEGEEAEGQGPRAVVGGPGTRRDRAGEWVS